MEILKIVGIGLVGAVCYLLLKDNKPEIALLINIACSIAILMIVADYFAGIISTISNIVAKTGIDSEIIGSVLKIIGVGYITEFGAGLCEDSGSKSIADKVLLGGKVIIMILSLPILTALMNLIAGLLQ